MPKQYTHENVSYGFAGKWTFNAGGNIYRTDLKGGVATAHKVARVVNGAFKRTNGGLDNLARANITKIVGSAA